MEWTSFCKWIRNKDSKLSTKCSVEQTLQHSLLPLFCDTLYIPEFCMIYPSILYPIILCDISQYIYLSILYEISQHSGWYFPVFCIKYLRILDDISKYSRWCTPVFFITYPSIVYYKFPNSTWYISHFCLVYPSILYDKLQYSVWYIKVHCMIHPSILYDISQYHVCILYDISQYNMFIAAVLAIILAILIRLAAYSPKQTTALQCSG